LRVILCLFHEKNENGEGNVIFCGEEVGEGKLLLAGYVSGPFPSNIKASEITKRESIANRNKANLLYFSKARET